VAAAPPGLSHSWSEENSLGVTVENCTELALRSVGVRIGGFLKLDALLCLNHCRSAPLYTSCPSLLAFLLPPIPRRRVRKPRAQTAARAELWRSIDSSTCCDSGLCFCFALAWARTHAPVQTCTSRSRFQPPSSVPSVGQIACASHPMASAARPCQPMAVAIRLY
jgi:hypothetical protein